MRRRPAVSSTALDPVRAYRFHSVRLGVQATLLVVVMVAPILLFFSSDGSDLEVAPALVLLAAAAIGAATVAIAPWERLLDSRLGPLFFYAWSVFDVLLITLAIVATGGASSELFFLYVLTTTLFAISYPPRGQAALLAFTVGCYLIVLATGGWAMTAAALVLRLSVLGTLAFLGAFLAREMNRQLSSQLEVARKLRELDDLRSDFLSTVSHELRTPLTAIGGFATTLGKHWSHISDEIRIDLVQRISENAQELDHLIAELLDFSRMERGLLKVAPVPTDVRRVVQDTLAVLRLGLAQHRVEVDVAPGLVALADPSACARILQNLLTNAAKFSPTGTTISVRAHESGPELLVAVADEGIGIPTDEHQRIFDRFYRVERGDRAAAGTGIGLAIVHEFAQAQRGRVWVDSEPGLGSTFWFTLPAASRPTRSEDRCEPDRARPRRLGRDGNRTLTGRAP